MPASAANILTVSWRVLQDYLATPGWQAPVLGVIALIVMVAWSRQKRLKVIPAGIVTLVAVTLVSLLPLFDGVSRIGQIPQTLPQLSLPLAGLDFTVIMRSALAVLIEIITNTIESIIRLISTLIT